MKIKKLEWKISVGNVHYAKALYLNFSITKTRHPIRDEWVYTYKVSPVCNHDKVFSQDVFDSFKNTKAFAQHHFESLIKECIEEE